MCLSTEYRRALIRYRCSRELPKCATCRPWSSSCDYSRDASSSTVRKARRKNEAGCHSLSKSVGGPHGRNEEFPVTNGALPNNTRSVQPDAEALAIDNSRAFASERTEKPLTQQPSAPKSYDTESSNVSGDLPQPYSSFSFLNEAAGDLSKSTDISGSRSYVEAQAQLTQLHAAINEDGQARTTLGSNEPFVIPTRSAGYADISSMALTSLYSIDGMLLMLTQSFLPPAQWDASSSRSPRTTV